MASIDADFQINSVNLMSYICNNDSWETRLPVCFWSFTSIFLELNSLLKTSWTSEDTSETSYAVYDPILPTIFTLLRSYFSGITSNTVTLCTCCPPSMCKKFSNTTRKKSVMNYSLYVNVCHLSWRLTALGNNNYTWISFIRKRRASTFSKSLVIYIHGHSLLLYYIFALSKPQIISSNLAQITNHWNQRLA